MKGVVSLAVGIAITLVGFRFGSRVLHAPVWCASWIIAHSWPGASNAVQNLTYLAVNILSWAVVVYVLLRLLSKQRVNNHEN